MALRVLGDYLGYLAAYTSWYLAATSVACRYLADVTVTSLDRFWLTSQFHFSAWLLAADVAVPLPLLCLAACRLAAAACHCYW